MTDKPDLPSPEAVERLAQMLETDASDQRFMPSELTGLLSDDEYEIAATLRALSAERDELKQSLEKAVMACGEQARARGEAEGRLTASEMAGVVEGWKARAADAEAERDALIHDVTEYQKIVAELTAEGDALKAELAEAVGVIVECREEIDDYIRHEYPHDHPVQERYRERDFAANPARAFLARHQKETDT